MLGFPYLTEKRCYVRVKEQSVYNYELALHSSYLYK